MIELFIRIFFCLVGIVLNVIMGFVSNYLLEKFDVLGLLVSIVGCVIYLIVAGVNLFEIIKDDCFFGKLLYFYLYFIMPILTIICILLSCL